MSCGNFVMYLSTQDFVIYLLAGPKVLFGRQIDPEDESKPGILLFANDTLPRHCYFNRHGAGGPTMLSPCQDAVVMRNGEALSEEVQLNSGDVIGMGQHYLFLFKDPCASTHKVNVRCRKERNKGTLAKENEIHICINAPS